MQTKNIELINSALSLENGYMLLVKDKKAFRIVAFSYQNNNEEDVTNAYEIIQYY